MGQNNVILAESQALVRQGIRKIIESQPEFKVVGEAGDGLELLRLVEQVPADLVVTAISLPSLSGIEAAEQIKARHPEIKILILTMHKRRELLHLAIRAGADGYLLKEDSEPELFLALHSLRQGGTYVSPRMASRLEELFPESGGLPLEPRQRGSYSLTQREAQVLRLIAQGKSSKEIGSLLYLSFRTVQHHRANIKRKLKLKTNTDLIRYALRRGLAAP